jgi:hypothetical protein
MHIIREPCIKFYKNTSNLKNINETRIILFSEAITMNQTEPKSKQLDKNYMGADPPPSLPLIIGLQG